MKSKVSPALKQNILNAHFTEKTPVTTLAKKHKLKAHTIYNWIATLKKKTKQPTGKKKLELVTSAIDQLPQDPPVLQQKPMPSYITRMLGEFSRGRAILIQNIEIMQSELAVVDALTNKLNTDWESVMKFLGTGEEGETNV